MDDSVWEVTAFTKNCGRLLDGDIAEEAKLSYNGNLLVENRAGLIVNTEVFGANGTAERDAALAMLKQIPGTRQVTVGGDKAYDTADFVAECEI
jgi:hypothetical protein